MKWLDTDLSDAVVDTASTLQARFLTIPQNTGESARIGRKVTLTSIAIRINLRIAEYTNATRTCDTVRIMLVLDKQCNGAEALSSAILEGTQYDEFRKLESKNRFRVMYDKLHQMRVHSGGAQDATTGLFGQANKDIWIYKKCSIPLEYSGTAGVVSEMPINNLQLWTWSKSGRCVLDGKIRIRFRG